MAKYTRISFKGMSDLPKEETKPQLTVAQLIKKLKAMPQDALVWHEGCDCLGKADDVKFEYSDLVQETGYVLISRINGTNF